MKVCYSPGGVFSLREIELDAQNSHFCLQVLSTSVVKFSALEYYGL